MKTSGRGAPTTSRQITTKSGAKVTANYRGGNVRTIQAHNMRIDHGAHGNRRIVTEHNGRRVVSMGHGRGYSERAYYNRGGRAYYQRTYYYGGHRYAYAYRGYYYHGYRYYGYAPAYYYRPVYYGWAYNPWPAPVYYNWGWAGNPWYGAYNYYYTPYPAYPAANYWLTDYMMSEQLRAAYAAGLAAQGKADSPSVGSSADLIAGLWSSDQLIASNLEAAYGENFFFSPAGAAQPALSKEVKDALAEEVKRQLALDKNAAEKPKNASVFFDRTVSPNLHATYGGAAEAEEVPPALDPNFRYFVVVSDLELTPDSGDECQLTQGDVIYRSGDQVSDDNNIDVVVKRIKKDDCAIGTKGSLDANDIQEMHNQFRVSLEAGLKALAEKNGKDGLPKAPDTTTTSGEVPAPTPDNNVDADLQQQQKDADQLEAEVKNSGGQ
jgi:hypothetical protein